MLVEHSIAAVKAQGFRKFAMAGGVASNSALRAAMDEACRRENIELYYPSPIFCTDNAAMIGAAGYYHYMQGQRDALDLDVNPTWPLS